MHEASPSHSAPSANIASDATTSVPEEVTAVPAAVNDASASPKEVTATSAGDIDVAKYEQLVIDALHTVFDPEIPVDIYELGLIYSIDVKPDGSVAITMTLTTPACPVAGSMPGTVEKTVRLIDGVTDVTVDLVWEPTWSPAMMTEAARLQLNMY